MTKEATDKTPELFAKNYCLFFVDVLGQKTHLLESALVPMPDNKQAVEDFIKTIRQTVGAITLLQSDAKTLLPKPGANDVTGRRSRLTVTEQWLWDQMHISNIGQQNWSDGLLLYTPLTKVPFQCVMSGVYSTIATALAMSFMSLVRGLPIRGAIEVGWGVELEPGQIYGSALARAYVLESQKAAYPRVVVGEELLNFLDRTGKQADPDLFVQHDIELAKLCQEFICRDESGLAMLHFLGPGARTRLLTDIWAEAYDLALNFVESEKAKHLNKGDSKLATRYETLLNYFKANPK